MAKSAAHQRVGFSAKFALPYTKNSRLGRHAAFGGQDFGGKNLHRISKNNRPGRRPAMRKIFPAENKGASPRSALGRVAPLLAICGPVRGLAG